MRSTLLQPFDNLKQMAHGAGEAIQTDDYEYVARGHIAHQLCQHRPRARGTRAVLLMDQAAAGCLKLVDLGVGRLISVETRA